MANVNVKFNNKDYLLSCDDGQEESLKKLTKKKKDKKCDNQWFWLMERINIKRYIRKMISTSGEVLTMIIADWLLRNKKMYQL